MTTRRALVCGNPSAASGRAADRLARVRLALQARDVDVEMLHTEPEGRTPGIVAARIDAAERPFDVAIAVGGDGTFADVAKGILRAQRPCALGLVPMGTANDQAKSLGIPSGDEGLSTAVDIACDAHETMLDVGVIERLERDEVTARELFFDSFGVGLQSEVLHRRNVERGIVAKVPVLREVYRDQAVYAGALLDTTVRSFLEPTRLRATVIADGREVVLDPIIDLVVKNTAIYGGAWALARDSRPDDGVMEVVPFVGRRELFSKLMTDLAVLPDLEEQLAAFGVEHSKAFSARELDIELHRAGRPDVHTQIDGEEWVEGHHFRVHVQARRLPVRTPRAFVPPWASSLSSSSPSSPVR